MFSPRNLPVLFAVVSMLVVAGCIGVGAPTTGPTATPTTTSDTGSTPTPGSQPTTTAGAPTTTTPVAPGTAFPPGIDGSGIVDFETLSGTHERLLLADGAIVSFRSQVVRPDGSIDQASELRYTIGPAGTLVLISGIEREDAETRTTVDIYLNETTQTLRRTTDEDVEYSVRSRTSESEALVWGNLPWHVAQHAADLRVVQEGSSWERGSDDEVILRAVLDRSPGVPGNDTTVLMRVSRAGVVTEYESRHELAGEGAGYVTTYRVEQVGAVQVTPPSWLDSVPASASLNVHVFAGMTESGVLELEHAGGSDAIPSGSLVSLAGHDREWGAVFPGPLGPGESTYVFLDSTDQLQVADVEPPAGEVAPFPSEFTIRVVTADGVTLYEESLGWMPNR